MRKIAAIMIALALMAIATPTTSAGLDSDTKAYTGATGFNFEEVVPPNPAYGTCVEELSECVPRGNRYAILFGLDGTLPRTVNEQLGNGYEGMWLGGVILERTDADGNPVVYQNIVVKANDLVYQTNAASSTCIMDPAGDNTCDPDAGDGDTDAQSGWGCGDSAIADSPVANSDSPVWVLTIYLPADLNVCGGSTGSITGEFGA